jgi:gluconolactonase
MLIHPPSEITAEIFARLPDDMRKKGVPSEWRDGQPLGAPEHSLLEGPAFDRDGNLWCVAELSSH